MSKKNTYGLFLLISESKVESSKTIAFFKETLLTYFYFTQAFFQFNNIVQMQQITTSNKRELLCYNFHFLEIVNIGCILMISK